jgi:hypothetical protein
MMPILTAGLLAVSAAAWAQTQPPAAESAQQNVRESEQYERLVCTNAAFRAKRMQEECGTINDPQLHASCLASFNCGPGGPHMRRSNAPPPSETIR